MLILLDQKSYDWGKQTNGWNWPWPREVYAAVVDFCARAGVKALGFDVLFSDPSSYGVADDQSFGDALGGFGHSVAAVYPGTDKGGVKVWPDSIPTPPVQIDGLATWLTGTRKADYTSEYARFPIPEVARSAAVLGSVNFTNDPDGVYRRGRFFRIFDGKVVPSIALAMYVAGAENPPQIKIAPGRFSVNKDRIPIDADGLAILHFTSRSSDRTHQAYSAAAIVQSDIQLMSGDKPTVDPKELTGKYVLFGFSAPDLYDLRPSPLAAIVPGVEIHATMLDNLLSGSFMRAVPVWQTIVYLALLGVAAGLLGAVISGTVGTILLFVLMLPLPVAASFLMYTQGYWLQLIAGLVAVALALTGANVANYATEGRQRRYIKNAFQQYLSPAVIEQLIAHPERLQLGGVRRELSIFFSDLQGFTGISEGLSPEELTALLNDYLSAMTDIIQEEGGTIDKYEGDAIIAFWNAPIGQNDHAVRAIRAALRCQAKLTEMRPGFRDRVNKDMYMRVGVNTGAAVVGNMGSHTRFDYTMLGDAVNLASRLEGINKQFGTYTMMSQTTKSALNDAFPARELSRVAVVGRKEPVVVYEPMLAEEFESRRPKIEEFLAALHLFYDGRFLTAAAGFDALSDADPAAKMYARKCRELAKHYGVTSPGDAPPADWEGVWVMTEK